MTWIGLRDAQGDAVFQPSGLSGPQLVTEVDMTQPMLQGTLLFEFDNTPRKSRHNLLRYIARSPVNVNLRITISPCGTFDVLHSFNGRDTSFHLKTDIGQAEGSVRVWYTWDMRKQAGLLCARTENGEQYLNSIAAPQPLTLLDAQRLTVDHEYVSLCDEIRFFSVSNEVEPVGPSATIGAQSLINTPDGYIPISKLRMGNEVITREGETAQIRWIGSQTLPAAGLFKPHVIRAPYHKAARDILVAPEQDIEVSGSKVEYLFMTERVFAKAGHLADGNEIISVDTKLTVRYFFILLDRHAIIDVAGVPMPSLNPDSFNIGRGALRHSILAGLPPEMMPCERSLAIAPISANEAVAMAATR